MMTILEETDSFTVLQFERTQLKPSFIREGLHAEFIQGLSEKLPRGLGDSLQRDGQRPFGSTEALRLYAH